MRHAVLALLCFSCLPGAAQDRPAPVLEPHETLLARYSVAVAAPGPDAANPLAVVATVSFPRVQVRSVGDALAHLLVRTGYSLTPADRLDEAARHLLSLPLPESHRRLGPYRVDAMLRVLLGDPWVVSVDTLARSVGFQHLPARPGVVERRVDRTIDPAGDRQ